MLAPIAVSPISYFVAVAESSSFSAVGRRFGVPTSTVSRAVAALEDNLHTRLLHRTTRHVSLTTDGASLYEKVAPALRTIAAALGSASEQEEPAGLLRVTAPTDIGAAFLSDAITRFSARYPLISVDVWLTNRKVDLVGEGFDAAVRATGSKLKDSSMVAHRLTKLESHLYASPTYLARRGTPETPAETAHHDWIEFRGWKYPRELAFIRRGSRILCDDFLFVREALRAGAGLGVLPSFLSRADVDAGLLVNVLPKVRQPGGQIFLVYMRTKQMPKRLVAFREFLAGSFGSAGF